MVLLSVVSGRQSMVCSVQSSIIGFRAMAETTTRHSPLATRHSPLPCGHRRTQAMNSATGNGSPLKKRAPVLEDEGAASAVPPRFAPPSHEGMGRSRAPRTRGSGCNGPTAPIYWPLGSEAFCGDRPGRPSATAAAGALTRRRPFSDSGRGLLFLGSFLRVGPNCSRGRHEGNPQRPGWA